MQLDFTISRVDSVLVKIIGKRNQLALFELKHVQDTGKLVLKTVKLVVNVEEGYIQ